MERPLGPEARQEQVTLLDLLDRILNKGAVVSGDITLSVADVDLVYVGLRSLLSSVETAHGSMGRGGEAPDADIDEAGRRTERDRGAGDTGPVQSDGRVADAEAVARLVATPPRRPLRVEPAEGVTGSRNGDRHDGASDDLSRPRLNADPENIERGLAKLVMTLIELLRRLMERQAERRIEAGSVTDEEVERLGEAFMKLDSRMEELKENFGLSDDDLNLNLGPLGELM